MRINHREIAQALSLRLGTQKREML